LPSIHRLGYRSTVASARAADARRRQTAHYRKGIVDELIYASATALAEAIRTKQVSSEEVVDAYLQRIEEVNPKLNAVVQLPQTGRAEARDER